MPLSYFFAGLRPRFFRVLDPRVGNVAIMCSYYTAASVAT